jgi:hypothetical protein
LTTQGYDSEAGRGRWDVYRLIPPWPFIEARLPRQRLRSRICYQKYKFIWLESLRVHAPPTSGKAEVGISALTLSLPTGLFASREARFIADAGNGRLVVRSTP